MNETDTFEGKDLDEAIAVAAQALGIPEAELHYDVIEQGRKGLLGMGTRNVSIRVKRPVEHLTDREILNGEEPAHVVSVVAQRDVVDEVEDAGEVDDDEAGDREAGRDEEPAAEPLTGQALEVQRTLERMLELSALDLDVQPGARESGVSLRLRGRDRKLLKRRNAELLLALQFLLNRMARRAWPGVGRIHLSTDGEGNRRDEQLIGLTRQAAKQVSKTGRTRKLRPMNAYERRLVHLTVREFSGLTSNSDGNGAMKRVRISKVQNAPLNA